MTTPTDPRPAPERREEALADRLDQLRDAIMDVATKDEREPFGRRFSPVQATGLLHEAAGAIRALPSRPSPAAGEAECRIRELARIAHGAGSRSRAKAFIEAADIVAALAPSPGTREAARVLLAALERAQIDGAILKLFYNGQPSAALRALAAPDEEGRG